MEVFRALWYYAASLAIGRHPWQEERELGGEGAHHVVPHLQGRDLINPVITTTAFCLTLMHPARTTQCCASSSVLACRALLHKFTEVTHDVSMDSLKIITWSRW